MQLQRDIQYWSKVLVAYLALPTGLAGVVPLVVGLPEGKLDQRRAAVFAQPQAGARLIDETLGSLGDGHCYQVVGANTSRLW